jgi:hypothetical protein
MHGTGHYGNQFSCLGQAHVSFSKREIHIRRSSVEIDGLFLGKKICTVSHILTKCLMDLEMSHIYEVVLEVRYVSNYEDLRNLILFLTNINFLWHSYLQQLYLIYHCIIMIIAVMISVYFLF